MGRKIPRPRLKANSTASFKSKHHRQKDVDMDIHSIRLHQDLTSHAPKNEILPESILKSYRDQYQSSLATLAATAAESSAAAASSSSTLSVSNHAATPSPCNALVLYTPPEKTIHHVLNKVRESEAKTTIYSKSKQVKPPPASLRTSSSMDLDMN